MNALTLENAALRYLKADVRSRKLEITLEPVAEREAYRRRFR